MATQNFINECKNRANANRLGRFNLGGGGSGDLIVYGNSTQSGTPTPSNPVPIVNKTGWITENRDGTVYEINLGDIELCKIDDKVDCIKKMVGKNMLDKSLGFQLGYINSSNVFVQDNSNALFNQEIQVSPSTTYTFSVNQSINNMVISFYNGDTFIGRQKQTNTNKITYTMANNVNKVRWCICIDTSTPMTQQLVDGLEPMIEKGSSRTTYEPYNLSWYIEKNIGKIVYDGSNDESWNKNSLTYYISQTSPKTNYALCDHFINQGNSSWGNNNTSYRGKFSLGYTSNNARFMPTDEEITTTVKWKTWLSSNNITIIYALSTPEYTKITDETLIYQLENPVNEINQSNKLVSMEFKDSCCVENNILGSLYVPSVEVELLNLPANTDLVGQSIAPQVGVRYANDSTEYIQFDEYKIESVNDEQTGSNTKFTAMNGGTLLDKEYVCSLDFEEEPTHTINEFYQDACEQLGLTPLEATFDNSEIELPGNPFTNKETIRTVLSEVEKVSCSIIKIDWANKTISLTWLSSQIDYEFNTSDYSTLEGSLTQYGPLNVIIIANSELNGENVVMTDQQSVDLYGEHQIIIDSPYFLYTEALRQQAIQAIYNKLDGLTYYDLKLTTPYGKPFLEIGNKIRINTNENQTFDTYVLSHTFKYDGAFSSVIESPALTQEEQTVKNELKGNSVKERLKRTEVIVDKANGEITAIADKVSVIENQTGDTYSKEEIDEMLITAETGLTNKFITNGGNNIFRNTGLWFKDTSSINYLYPSDTLYCDDDLVLLAEPYYEYWQGKVEKMQEDKASNRSGMLLQNTTLSQTQEVKNDTYTVSFKYKKTQLANLKVVINGQEFTLSETEDTEFVYTFGVTAKYITVSFICNIDNGAEIYDLMVNVGEEKAEYSQNQNETTTDTVNISKGITITSSDTNTTFKADSDGIRVFDSNNLDGDPLTKFTQIGTETKKIIVEEEAQVVGVLFRNVGNNTWINKL